ncbi:MAG TPA: glycosyl hydrolase family 28-related protein [Alphaproteobacteria bacterium]|nr:glycosyl hydrolase family 28-related protein [Alphaproteobacteria bacterium]HNS43999.1 glycosyl hydrolase family 28-related protein [Alphaproteobacteria bacterium]
MTEHIRMPDVVPLVRYLANGTQSVFEYPFPIFASEDLKVLFDGAEQISGFTIDGAGATAGGTVTFDVAPISDVVVTLERRMAFERLTDFVEGGNFAAAAINAELDFLVAGLQQVSRDQIPMLRFDEGEAPSVTSLPARDVRAGKALGFDGNGDPVAVSLAGSMAAPDFTAVGNGAVTRTNHDKFSDFVSVKDFGAVGDGLTDDTLAFQQALAAHDHVFVPSGVYIVTGTIAVGDGQSLAGAGDSSEIKTSSSIVLVHLTGSYARLATLKLFGGDVGIKLSGLSGPCVQNAVVDVSTWQAQTGILLDGGSDTGKPCYWNNFVRVLVAQPFVNGIHLKRSGAGDTPNANRFMQCRVYSLGATTSGSGIYIEEGSFNNSFTDTEVNVNGTAQACVRCGAGSNKTIFVNLYCESSNSVPNVKLDAGSIETAIYNLLSASDGAAIWDLSGGQYTAFNAGYPYKNRLQKTTCTDLTSTLQRYDTEYIDASGTVTLDLSHSIHLVSSYGGALTVQLPNAADAAAAMMMVKKIDTSKNIITVTESGGTGPDDRSYYLGGENDFVMMMSNGAEWFVISTNRSAGNTRYYDGSGTYDIDMAVDVYLLSSYGGVLTARLPPANAPEAIGRMVTIKKTDVSANPVMVSELGGSGPDQYTQSLTSQFQSITVVSDGGHWYIVSRFS